MKRASVIQYLELAGWELKRESQSHSLWKNASTDYLLAVPNQEVLSDRLGSKICRTLGKDNRIPKVDSQDVHRIIKRDFGTDQARIVFSLLISQSSAHWSKGSGKDRIFLAILKLAGGDVDAIPQQIQAANLDPRDLIGFAEYPRFMKIGFIGAEKLNPIERQKLLDDDYQDYLNWLCAK
jgi:predicted RNA binding protein YcfA (HicA-like mRNA interferase family)